MAVAGESGMGAETLGGVVLFEREGSIARIRLGAPAERVVLLSESRMTSLERAIEQVAADPGITGLVITGSGPGMFCAGADIKSIKDVSTREHGEELAARGQKIFDKIEALKCKTVAAISGPCVGGGCELVLACKYRVITDLPSSKIGLPEVRLGILPGFGGTQRLPRLIGLPQALEIILKAKVVLAQQARSLGLVDELVTGETEDEAFELLQLKALDLLLGRSVLSPKPLSLLDRVLTHTNPGRLLVKRKAKAGVLKETKGHYPAPLRALECACYGLGVSLEEGLLEERRGLADLIISRESKALCHLYFISEDASKIGRGAKGDVEAAVVAIIGGGVMGAGIGAAFLSSGHSVKVVETVPAARERAGKQIAGSLEKKRSLSAEKRGAMLQKLEIGEQVELASSADVIIEAIIEDLTVKRDLFGKLREISGDQAVLATNTSSLRVRDIALGLKGAEKVVGLHFFNPAEKMPLVEVVRTKETSDRTTVYACALATKIGKYPVIVEDVPGFLVNRILTPYLIEASQLLTDGFSIREIDVAAEKFGMPMGPMRLLDEVGLDIAAKVSHVMEEAYPDRMKGSPYAETLTKKGRLGRKSGQGFYSYAAEGEPVPDVNIRTELSLPVQAPPPEVDPAERLVLALINEAVRCLDEGVAGARGKDAAGQIDLATVMGMGFPPFRGGVIFYAQQLGAKAIFSKLEALEKKHGKRFSAADGIRSRAQSGGSFYS